MSDRGTPTGGLEKPERSDSRILAHPYGAGAKAAYGYRGKGFLQRHGWFGAVEKEARAHPGRRLHVSERSRAPMERADCSLSLHHRAGGGRFYSCVAGARLSSRGSEAHVSAGPADCAIVSFGRAPAVAVAPGTSRALIRNVPYTTSFICDGDVRVRVSLVLDGSAAAGNLARLPPRHRAESTSHDWAYAPDLPHSDVGFRCDHGALSAHRRTPRLLHYTHRNSIGVSAAWICRLHFRLGQSQPVVVVASDANCFHLLRHGFGDRRRDAAVHAHHSPARETDRHPLPRQDRAVSALRLHHRLQPGNARFAAAHLRSRRILPQPRFHGAHAPVDVAGDHPDSSRNGDPHRTARSHAVGEIS